MLLAALRCRDYSTEVRDPDSPEEADIATGKEGVVLTVTAWPNVFPTSLLQPDPDCSPLPGAIIEQIGLHLERHRDFRDEKKEKLVRLSIARADEDDYAHPMRSTRTVA